MSNVMIKGGKYGYTHSGWFNPTHIASAQLDKNMEKMISFRLCLCLGGVL